MIFFRKENQLGKVCVIKTGMKLFLLVTANFLIQKFQESTKDFYEAIRMFS